MSCAEQRSTKRPDWLLKTLAGLLPGLAIAFVAVAFFLWYGPGALPSGDKTQFAMWLVPLSWLLILAGVYLFSSGRRAWIVLSSVAAVLYIGFFFLRSLA